MKYSRGFTLIELLVVITILAILSTVATLYYHGLQGKAKDSARRSDIYEIATALEVNKTTQGYVPLEVNQFSSFQWMDPGQNVYCIGVGNPGDPGNIAAWGVSCPAGFAPVAPGVPVGSFSAWKVCTFLENPGDGKPNVFCRTSRQ